MTFREKSLWATLGSLLFVGWYYFQFYFAFSESAADVVSSGWAPRVPVYIAFAVMVVVLVVLLTVSHIVIAVLAPRDAEAGSDERDALIELKGEHLSGIVLGMGVLAIATLSVFDAYGTFVIAHLLLASMFVAEIIGIGAKLFYYRQGV